MNTIDSINKDLVSAMKSKDAKKLNVLRSVKAAFSNALTQKSRQSITIDVAEATGIIRKLISQRADSVDQFEKGGRIDLAENEKKEIEILSEYLPPELDEISLDSLVNSIILEFQASSKKDAGRVIKEAVVRVNGCADNKKISALVMAKLN